MKKLLLIVIVLVATAFIAQAQTEKGKWMAGAAIGFSSDTDDDPNLMYKVKTVNMNFQPGLSYFITDDMALGLILGIGSYKYSEATTEYKSSSLVVAPSFRYYLPISDRFKFFGQVLVPIGSSKVTIEAGNAVDEKTQNLGVNIIPAFAFFPSPKISIEMALGAIYFTTSKSGDVKSNQAGVVMIGSSAKNNDIGLGTPTIGFKFHFGK